MSGQFFSDSSHPVVLYDMQKMNGKAIPLQFWTGPEGSRKLRLPDFREIGT